MAGGGTTGKKRKRTKSPVDLGKLKEAMGECSQACEAALDITLAIDVTASDELIECLLASMRIDDPRTQLRCVLLAADLPALPEPCNLCVIVAGQSLRLGELYARAAEAGVPCVVALEEGETFFASTPEEAAQILQNAGGEGTEPAAAPAGLPCGDIVVVEPSGPNPLDELAAWIARELGDLRLALAVRYPFCREAVAMELTRSTARLNAGVGVLFMIPGADMPVITLNQAKLAVQIAAIYGQPLDAGRLREVAAVVAGAFGFRAVARELSEAVPGLGWGVKGAVAYSGTMAVGQAALDCFREGGTLNNLGAAIARAVEQAAPHE